MGGGSSVPLLTRPSRALAMLQGVHPRSAETNDCTAPIEQKQIETRVDRILRAYLDLSGKHDCVSTVSYSNTYESQFKPHS